MELHLNECSSMLRADATASAAPTQLQLHNINLAVIIGPAVITGGAGSNTVHADNHPQTIILGADDDTLKGGPQADSLIGGSGNDMLSGGPRRDTLKGAYGNDILKGQRFQDLLQGGYGDDTIFGGKGKDILKGGEAADTFRLSKGKDTIRDFAITDGDFIEAPKQHNISLIQQGKHLLLSNDSRNIHTTILNLSADQLISHQPDLF